MTSLPFNTLKEKNINILDNTNDLVNGLFLTINTTSRDFDYASAYELLPEIVSKIYCTVGSKAYSLEPKIKAPNVRDIDFASIANQLVVVSCIGLNRNGQKTHIHFWVYNIHCFNYEYQSFKRTLIKELKHLKGVSQRNEFSVKLIPVKDSIDKHLRAENHNNQVIIDYITKREYDTLMGYFATKNNQNFIYFY